ncbi:CvpA family protein [Dyella sp. M7H15-1]|uniref:CvpA family protein n=1 Tax=Dyella sp. M7H15-1 TaxID=2501295 RepID=UPI001004EB90|nr:CvpA family protein [Dyella sp. M7H15-1]QAU23218.1 CvpA family protein [Dyella sp. M7H15-1]
MNAVDLVIIVVLALSVLVGLFSGLVSEVLSLLTWIGAYVVARIYGPEIATQLGHTIQMPMLRVAVGYGVCFVAVLIVGALVRFMVRQVVFGTGLDSIDRLLGMVFGFGRGVLLVALCVFLVDLTSFAREPAWRQSALVPQFDGLVAWLRQELPSNMLDRLRPHNLHMPNMQNMQSFQNLKNVLPAGSPPQTPNHPAAASSAAVYVH